MPIFNRAGRPSFFGRATTVTAQNSDVQFVAVETTASLVVEEPRARTPREMVAEITALAKRHQAGALTDFEFAAAKAELFS